MDAINEIRERLAECPGLKSEVGDSAVVVYAADLDGFDVAINRGSGGDLVHFEGWHEDFEDGEAAFQCF